jgi:hypothetical protein
MIMVLLDLMATPAEEVMLQFYSHRAGKQRGAGPAPSLAVFRANNQYNDEKQPANNHLIGQDGGPACSSILQIRF